MILKDSVFASVFSINFLEEAPFQGYFCQKKKIWVEYYFLYVIKGLFKKIYY